MADDGRVTVLEWPAGEALPSPVGGPAELAWPLDETALEDLRWYLEEYLRAPFGVYGERGPRVEDQLPRWGARIFEAVFGAGPSRDAYLRARARGGPVEIVVRSDSAEHLGLPWELMADPGRPTPIALGGQVAISRSLRNLPKADVGQVLSVKGKRLRVLMVISRPKGTKDVGYQMIARPLLRRLEAVRDRVELVVLRPPTLERLEEVLSQARAAGEPFQIVHFDGHGVFGQVAAEPGGGWGPLMFREAGPQGMLAFEQPGGGTDLVPAGQVAQVLAAAQVRVVVLNACQSAVVGSRVEAAVATRLLQEGTAAVVAMAYSVYAVAAAEFMAAFYERLFAGDRVAEAVAAGRRRLALKDRRPSPKGMLPLADWVVPVLYTRSEVHFPELHTDRGAKAPVEEIFDRILEQSEDTGTEPGDELAAVGEFVGRDALLYTLDVAARLQRVVVLHGPGGAGKTEVAKAFGRWWRDTGAVDDPAGVIWHSFEPGVASFGLDGVINAIGLRVFGTLFARLDTSAKRRAAVEEVLATRRLLLLWDNFESVHTMPDPAQATPPLSEEGREELGGFLARLARGGRSAVVVTSRTPEDWLGQVRRIEVPSLDSEEASRYAEHLLAPYPTAQQHRQSKAFGELMQWLDGHPLSMRLVLPHLETTGPQNLLAGLQGTTAFPVGDGGDRTTSLSAGIAYSFTHLPAADQRALSAVSLFHGVADADVLGTFSQAPETPERFRGLDASGWQQVLDRAAGVGLLTPLGAGMYRIHPALPAYLAARWRAENPDDYSDQYTTATQALLGAYADFSDWLLQELQSENAQFAVALIDHQRRTLGSLLGYALDHGRWEHAQAIAQPMNEYWNARGLWEEARAWVDRARLALETPDGVPPDLAVPAGRLWLFLTGTQAGRQTLARQLDDAERTYRDILHALQQQPPTFQQRAHLATSYHQLGVVAQGRGRLEEAEGWYRQSLAIEEDHGNRPGLASSYHQLGIVAFLRGRLEEAEGWYRRSLAIEEELGNRPGLARSYHQLGMVAQGRGRLEEAEGWYRRSLAIEEELGNRPGLARSYHQLGMVAQERGRLEEAEGWYRRSLAIEEELGDRPGLARNYHRLGTVAFLRGRLEEAEGWYRRFLTIKDLGNPLGLAATYGQLGLLAEAREQPQEALTWMVRCVALFDQFPHPATGPGPDHLRRLTHTLGVEALERTWQAVTGAPLPPAVRQYVLTDPPAAD